MESPCTINAEVMNPKKNGRKIPRMTLIKGDLRGLLLRIHGLVESTIGIMPLLLHRGAKLEQILGDVLVRGLEDVDKPVNIC